MLTVSSVVAQRGFVDGEPDCPGHVEETPASECPDACTKFAGHVVHDHEAYNAGGCYVEIVQINGDCAGRIVSDACGQLASQCSNAANATAKFKAQNESNGSGTIQITWDKDHITQRSDGDDSDDSNDDEVIRRDILPWGSAPNCGSGPYQLQKEDCSQAIQQAFPEGKGLTGGDLHKTVGGCKVDVPKMGGTMAATAMSNAAQDILANPDCCNSAGLCRTTAGGTFDNHVHDQSGSVSWSPA